MAYNDRGKECAFCRRKVVDVDYKDSVMLGRYITNWSRIKPGKDTGTCSRHQRRLAEAIKRARYLALLPYETR